MPRARGTSPSAVDAAVDPEVDGAPDPVVAPEVDAADDHGRDPASAGRRALGAARRWRLLVLAAVLSGVAVSGGCATARNSLGTSNSPCFVAIPGAAAAVRHQGRLGGVRLVTWGQLTRSSHVYQVDVKRHLPAPQKLCLVAYFGTFERSEVRRPAGAARAHLAIVMVLWPKNALLRTLLVHRPPTRFGHPRIGAGG